MLDPGTQALLSAFASPVVIAVVGYVAKRYFEKQDETLKSISDTLSDIKIKLAVTENRSLLIEEIREDVQRLRDEHVITKSSVDAAWRVLDKKRAS